MPTPPSVMTLLVWIAEATTVASVWQLATGYFASSGFSRVNYGFTRFLDKRGIGDPADAMFLTTTNAEQARQYFAGGHFARTPAFKWAQMNSGACTWRWVRERLERGELSPDEVDALRKNAALGITAGITISFPETSLRTKGAIGLIADLGLTEDEVEAIFAERESGLLPVAHLMHLKLQQFPIQTSRALTRRQREALEWVADGKTTQHIAVLMGVTAGMVEKHLRLAREALGVETTAQAVAKAAILNMIYLRPCDEVKGKAAR